ncbi:MAG: hypothetical protein JSW71_19760 [Gemmatimonadota bacterium]|nr:MAG: hypothetical protein JSW71_19760 [Gemmatimonadota bacterium]
MEFPDGGSKDTERRLRISAGFPLLAAAAVLLPLSNGRWIIPLATWVVPVVLVRYLRTSPKLWRGVLAVYLVLFVTTPVTWLGLWPFPPPVIAKIAAVGAVYSLVPYLLDRFSETRIQGAVQTLVFPCSAVAVEFLASLRSETSWGNLAYTQADNLPLLQLASIAGVWGITFVMLWLAPVLNNLWRSGWSDRRARTGVVVYGLVVAAVVLFGSWRLICCAPSGETFRAATVSPPEILDITSPEDLQLFQQIMMKQEVDEVPAATLRETFNSTYDRLFDDTRREAQAGAELVVWPEASLISFDDEQDAALIERAKRLASEEGVYLGVTIALIPVDSEKLNENRLLLISPSGEVLQTYWKHHTVPVVEQPYAIGGSRTPAVHQTSFATIGGVICYDMDSPRYLRHAGREKVDVLVAPSGDWPAIKQLHPRMAVLRAVEQGFSLVRPANHGLTVAVDYQGRILGRLDHYTTSDRRMSVQVPKRGTTTVYARTGDLLPWACLALTVISLVLSVRSRSSGHSTVLRWSNPDPRAAQSETHSTSRLAQRSSDPM